MDTKRDNLWRDMSTTIYDIFLKNGDFAAEVLAFRAPFLDPPKRSPNRPPIDPPNRP